MKNLNLFVPKFRNDEIIEHITECLDKGMKLLQHL